MDGIGIRVVSSPFLPFERDVPGPGEAPHPYRRVKVHALMIAPGEMHLSPEAYRGFAAIVEETGTQGVVKWG